MSTIRKGLAAARYCPVLQEYGPARVPFELRSARSQIRHVFLTQLAAQWVLRADETKTIAVGARPSDVQAFLNQFLFESTLDVGRGRLVKCSLKQCEDVTGLYSPIFALRTPPDAARIFGWFAEKDVLVLSHGKLRSALDADDQASRDDKWQREMQFAKRVSASVNVGMIKSLRLSDFLTFE